MPVLLHSSYGSDLTDHFQHGARRVIKNSKVQEPQNDGNDDNGIQNRLYGSRHRDEPVDNP
jgi:hypothetical protein